MHFPISLIFVTPIQHWPSLAIPTISSQYHHNVNINWEKTIILTVDIRMLTTKQKGHARLPLSGITGTFGTLPVEITVK